MRDDFRREMDFYLMVQGMISCGEVIQDGECSGITGSPLIRNVTLWAEALKGEADLPEMFKGLAKLKGYLDKADSPLLESLYISIRGCLEGGIETFLLIDGYECIENLDRWFRSALVKRLEGMKIIISGRNSLTQLDRRWMEGFSLEDFELGELDLEDVRRFLSQRGLSPKKDQDVVISFTGGYPLLLALAADFGRRYGWDKVKDFGKMGDRYAAAKDLLKWILKGEGQRELKELMLFGSAVDYISPDVIMVIFDMNKEDSVEFYDKLRRFSFIRRHKGGWLTIHEKIRQLMGEILEIEYPEEAEKIRKKVKLFT